MARQKKVKRAASSNSRVWWRTAIARFCDVWLAGCNKASKTLVAYRHDLVQFAELPKLPRSARRVTRAHLENWIHRLRTEGYQSSSIRRKLACLRSFFVYLVNTGLIDRSPFDGFRTALGTPRRLTRVVSRQDLKSILLRCRFPAASAQGRITIPRMLQLQRCLVIRILCVTGVRVGELVRLTRNDVMGTTQMLRIQGKGNRERLAYIADDATWRMLRTYLDWTTRKFPGEANLFLKSDGSSVTTDDVRLLIGSVARKADVEQHITPHMLRHTAATFLLENCSDLRLVQEFLGHDSIRSTERYAHITPTHLRNTLRRAHPLKRVA